MTSAIKFAQQDTFLTKQVSLAIFVSLTVSAASTTKTAALATLLLIRDNLMTAHLDVNLSKVITKVNKELQVNAHHNVKRALLSVLASPATKDSSFVMIIVVLPTALLVGSQTV